MLRPSRLPGVIFIYHSVCQWLTSGRWFPPGPLVSSTNKTDRHDITEILLKVALNTISPPQTLDVNYIYWLQIMQFTREKMVWFGLVCLMVFNANFNNISVKIYIFGNKLIAFDFSLFYCLLNQHVYTCCLLREYY
jgi:hypothetical protein